MKQQVYIKLMFLKVDYDLYKIKELIIIYLQKDVLKWVKVLTLNLKFIMMGKIRKKYLFFK